MISDNAKENMRLATQFSFYTVAAFIIMYFAASLNSGTVSLTGMAVDPLADYSIRIESCQDGTPVYECSQVNIGNVCTPTKTGPDLRYSEKCYG